MGPGLNGLVLMTTVATAWQLSSFLVSRPRSIGRSHWDDTNRPVWVGKVLSKHKPLIDGGPRQISQNISDARQVCESYAQLSLTTLTSRLTDVEGTVYILSASGQQPRRRRSECPCQHVPRLDENLPWRGGRCIVGCWMLVFCRTLLDPKSS